jgi:hypothetical protein
MYQSGSHWMDFRQFSYWKLSLQPVKKIQVWLHAVNNVDQFTPRANFVYIIDSKHYLVLFRAYGIKL